MDALGELDQRSQLLEQIQQKPRWNLGEIGRAAQPERVLRLERSSVPPAANIPTSAHWGARVVQGYAVGSSFPASIQK